ncbi:MAG: calcium/sodium antiporter [Thermoguttaceae bacterium]|jgi:cation:H+ antiporter|nr:calcium/sodium antiporter [Thermoguttaceae bacterium]
MILAAAAVVFGLLFLVLSADRFVEGSAATARHIGVPPLVIGMVIVGFGTSAPEMVVSAISAAQGNPGLAMGNAYGSNIANIGLILGLTALISPIAVHSQVLRKELPVLLAITLLAAFQIHNGEITRTDAWVLLVLFALIMIWTVIQGVRQRGDSFSSLVQKETEAYQMPLGRAVFWLVVGLLGLILSSRILVWGAVEIAEALGVSDLVIGLTIVALGTSLPELASSLAAMRKGEHDIALGNVLGSNLFNTLAVVGIAGAIHPMAVAPEVLSRDWLVMGLMTLALSVIGYGFGRPGRINRFEGGALLTCYVCYMAWLVSTSLPRP